MQPYCITHFGHVPLFLLAVEADAKASSSYRLTPSLATVVEAVRQTFRFVVEATQTIPRVRDAPLTENWKALQSSSSIAQVESVIFRNMKRLPTRELHVIDLDEYEVQHRLKLAIAIVERNFVGPRV